MKILVFRFSAMGDVALSVPVVRGVLAENPELEITFVTNRAFEAMFSGIERLKFYGVDMKAASGFGGLFALYRDLSKLGKWDCIIDLHSVMRTWVLGFFFKLTGKKVYRIDKGREEKAALVSSKNRQLLQLKHSTERYKHVFEKAGIKGVINTGKVIRASQEAELNLEKFFEANKLEKQETWIGIAPFSKHVEKEWPIEKVIVLIDRLSQDSNLRIVLLGGGPEEEKQLKEIASRHSTVLNFAGVLGLAEEISLINKLDCVVAMDSFNMHLASLCGTPVVSIWGATHPFAGFGPLNDNERLIVQTSTDELDCRPCSVFGSKKCARGDLACLERIEVDQVHVKIKEALEMPKN